MTVYLNGLEDRKRLPALDLLNNRAPQTWEPLSDAAGKPRPGMFGSRLYRLNELGRHAEELLGRTAKTSDRQKADQTNFCDLPLPGGGTIRRNVREVGGTLNMIRAANRLTGQDPNKADREMFAYWLSNVSPGGRWAGRLKEPAGNHNYGATGRALGLPLSTLLRGAGAGEWFEAVTGRTGSGKKGTGNPLGAPPYGDTEEGQKQIRQGYYARCG